MVQGQKFLRWSSSVRDKGGGKRTRQNLFYSPGSFFLTHGPAAQTPNKGEGLKDQQLDFEGQHYTWLAMLHCSKTDDIKNKMKNAYTAGGGKALNCTFQ